MTDDKDARIRYVDADGMASQDEPAIIIFDIAREEILAGDTSGALERLQVLTETAESVRRYRECLVFQVSGYDDDPRVIVEIPEIRSFFEKLAQDWPHWLWFLRRSIGAVPLLMSLLCRVEVLRDLDGGVATEFLDMGELKSCLIDLFARANTLFETFQISPGEIISSAQSAADELSGQGG
ncbi:MAG: hypothetical protein PHU46_17935 [Rhodocyclaceae bacterium]|nr:hypothetical protein [Rhodocyclaceae bacterium]